MRIVVPVMSCCISVAAAASGAAWAQSSPVDSVLACLTVPDGPERLACFNARVPALRGAAALTRPADQGLGAEQLPKSRTADADGQPDAPDEVLHATLAGLRQNAEGRAIFTLDNGQVWLQRESGAVRLKVGDAVTVKPGALGSYSLGAADRPGIIKVRRIK